MPEVWADRLGTETPYVVIDELRERFDRIATAVLSGDVDGRESVLDSDLWVLNVLICDASEALYAKGYQR